MFLVVLVCLFVSSITHNSCPERGTGNDPESLDLAFHQGPNLVDRNGGGGNDLLRPSRSLSEFFV